MTGLMNMAADSIVISHYQAEPLLAARDAGATAISASRDLGLTHTDAAVTDQGIEFADGRRIDWDSLETIAGRDNACFRITDQGPQQLKIFAEATGMLYTLFPTVTAPALLISGITMHRIVNCDPLTDAKHKVGSAAPIRGAVLDTAAGLGYTAIEAARSAERVVSIEVEPAVLELARANPWSTALFSDPKIALITGDTAEEIRNFGDGEFTCIVHDPPFRFGEDLFTAAFYSEACRVLRPGGRMFHFIGAPDKKTGQRLTTGIMRRLQEAGFGRVDRKPAAFGVTAHKTGRR